MKRRQFSRWLASSAALPFGGFAVADPAAGSLIMLEAGPAGEQTSRWGNAAALAMQAGFPSAPPMIVEAVGGLDGVTGANRLDALVPPDGSTAAILPGAALIAWITGDSRVHFDPTRWVPLMVGTNSGVLAVRLPPGTPPTMAALRAIAPLRLAADQPQSNDLAALLALARLGVETAPVFGLRGMDAKAKAFVAGEVDGVFVCGEGVPEDLAPLAAAGAVPVFCLGNEAADGSVSGDPLFPNLPDVMAFGGNVAPFLDAAYRGAAAAARVDFIVVLPKLTDPGAVSAWQQAANLSISSPAMQAAASASSIMLNPAPVAAAALNALNLVTPVQTDLQAFLVKSFGWQPG